MLIKGICFKITLHPEKGTEKKLTVLSHEGNVLYVVTNNIDRVMQIVGYDAIKDVAREGIGYFNDEDLSYSRGMSGDILSKIQGEQSYGKEESKKEVQPENTDS